MEILKWASPTTQGCKVLIVVLIVVLIASPSIKTTIRTTIKMDFGETHQFTKNLFFIGVSPI